MNAPFLWSHCNSIQTDPACPGACKGRIAAGLDAHLMAFDDDWQSHTLFARRRVMVADGEPIRRSIFGRIILDRLSYKAYAPRAAQWKAARIRASLRRNKFKAFVAGLAVGILLSGPAAADNVLRWGNADDAKTADPHSYSDIENNSVMQQIYDTLVALDSDMNVADHLAVAWKPLNTTTWEFELRQGVRFHDGAPFTRMSFSIRRAQADTSDVKDQLRSVVDVQASDGRTVQFTTDGPDPLLWANLAGIKILAKGWAEAHGVMLPADSGPGRITTHQPTPTAPGRSSSRSSTGLAGS